MYNGHEEVVVRFVATNARIKMHKYLRVSAPITHYKSLSC